MLMTVAVVYKFVLVILGAAYFYYLVPASLFGVREIFPSLSFGLLLNVILVVVNSGNYVDAEYYAAMCAFF